MASIEDCFLLGYITRPFGLKGELVVSLDVDEPALYNNLKSVFINIGGSLVPHFIEKITPRAKDAVWKFEDLSVEESNRLLGSEMYLPMNMLPKLSGNKFYFHEVIGFKVIDKNFGELGILKQIYDQGPQPILSIDREGTEIMIPLIDDFLEQVDREGKALRVKAPEGLIEFYL